MADCIDESGVHRYVQNCMFALCTASIAAGARRSAVLMLLLVAGGYGCGARRGVSTMLGRESDGAALPSQRDTSLSDDAIERRLTFLTDRLDAGERHAKWWQYGWLGVNGGGAAASAAIGATDNGNGQVYDVIEATKSAIGTVYLIVDPMPGEHGADPIRAMPRRTHADRLAQLTRAEQLLHDAAVRAEERHSLFMHLGNLGLNLAGGIALFALGDPGDAAMSVGIDTAVGEGQIWSQPWTPAADWADYERFIRGAPPAARHTSWRIAPAGRGLSLAVRF